MEFSESSNNLRLWRLGWHWLFLVLITGAIGTSIAAYLITYKNPEMVSIVWFLIPGLLFAIVAVVAVFAVLLLTYENVRSIKDNAEKLDTMVELTNRNRELLTQMARNIRLSDTAKEIAFRDTIRMELAEAVLTKLHQHDFDSTNKLIDAMAKQAEYLDLAEQLRLTAQKFRDGTEEERINQIITHIDELCSEYHWGQASAKIARLIKDFPESQKAKNMVTRLYECKDKRKRELLTAWDEAVKNQETDRSLEILKELDLYLTPTEGLALQESAISVFKTKLHNLGMKFSLAVTEKKWQKALEAGEQIVSDFPNSKMAHEIRGKMDILKQRAKSC